MNSSALPSKAHSRYRPSTWSNRPLTVLPPAKPPDRCCIRKKRALNGPLSLFLLITETFQRALSLFLWDMLWWCALSERARGSAMPKNIVICLDGTANEFGQKNSNVIKLYATLVQDPQAQVAYYHPGLGTMGAPGALTKLAQSWTRLKGLAFGYGLAAGIGDAYSFLMETYQAGDNIYIFGFSRGAYTARSLAAMLHMYGLLRPGNEALVPYITRLFRSHDKAIFALAAKFKDTFSSPCKPRFLGLYDTVSSVGWIYSPVKLPYTAQNPDVSIVRHAV